jgi:hypothetical protein
MDNHHVQQLKLVFDSRHDLVEVLPTAMLAADWLGPSLLYMITI